MQQDRQITMNHKDILFKLSEKNPQNIAQWYDKLICVLNIIEENFSSSKTESSN